MARSSLLAGSISGTAGCLVTEVPDYAEVRQTRPFMLVETANPPTSTLLGSSTLTAGGYAPVSVAVDVLSEDDGDYVQNRLFLSARSSVQVMEPDFVDSGPDLEPGTWNEGGRTMSATIRPNALSQPGCYELFWLATHEADFRQCPRFPDDSTRISWTVLLCSGASCGDAELEGCNDNVPQVPCATPSGGSP